MRKTLLANSIVQFLIGRLIGGYMLLVGVTTRWTSVNQAAVEPFWNGQGRIIACIWHGRFIQFHKMWRFGAGAPKAKMLISQSREGGVVVHAANTVGADIVRGSSAKNGAQKGGIEAMRLMTRHIQAGGIVGMTPDGPRGPRMRVKRGTVQLAKLAGAPMLPVAWSASNRIVFEKSWDKSILPLPFGRGALVWGDPIDPPSPGAGPAEFEAVRLKLEAEMNRIALEADRLAGVAPIEPAPAPAADAVEPEAAPAK
jgi:lysophospholipid acyltransferase (LPLAT)-like uncharacterized protein